MTNPPQPTFTLARLFWVVTLIAAFFGTTVVAARERSIPVLISVFAISLIAQVAFVFLESTREVRRAFAIGFAAALVPLSFVAMVDGESPFVRAAVGAKSTNPMLPYFESGMGAMLVAIAIAVICGMFVASGRMLQRRRIGLVATTVFLILVWMFLWDVAVYLRKEKHLSPQRSAVPPGADFFSPSQAA